MRSGCGGEICRKRFGWGHFRNMTFKFAGTGTSQTCKSKEEFEVTTAAAGEVLTLEVLETVLRTIACKEAGSVYWYVGVVVTFRTLTGGAETVLTERLDKTTLNTLQRTLTAH